MNGLDCKDVVELVTAYLEGDLDAETEHRMADHLTICDGCHAFVEQVRATIRGLGQLPAAPLDRETRAALLALIRATPG